MSEAGNFSADHAGEVIDVRTGTRADVQRAVAPMVRAFWSFPETVHLLPRESNRRRVLPAYMRGDLLDAQRAGELFLAEDDGVVVGAAAWLPPSAYPISLRRQMAQLLPVIPVLPWAIGAAREGQRGQAQNKAHHAGYGPHHFLRAIGVDPSHQRRGVGHALMNPTLARADDEHVGCFLFTATEANAAWYQSLGFETAGRYNPTPTWPDVWAMWRAPR